MAQHVFQSPTGTRDLYPIEAARRRFIMEAWRRVSINHGFEEIDGPTFEHLDLYKVKSGEGIVNELFSFTRAGGEKDYALRPEFTPTLARMYAAKAASLPKPTKWFTAGPFFRAERPQRGRLREFLQWNCDFIGFAGEPKTPDELEAAAREADADVIACVADLLLELGLKASEVKIRINDRAAMSRILIDHGVDESKHHAVFALLDRVGKFDDSVLEVQANQIGIPLSIQSWFFREKNSQKSVDDIRQETSKDTNTLFSAWEQRLLPLRKALVDRGVPDEMIALDSKIVRGLAYYTGMVFEVIVDGERAVAGGGRYDNLIGLFGGQSTPAVGFGMGDVVLSLVLKDKERMPSDEELMGMAGQNPDVFVISNGTPEADGALPGVLAGLRRGEARTKESAGVVGLHARRSYKTTKNVGKLMQDAVKGRARFAVIVESATEATIKDLKTGVQDAGKTAIEVLAGEIRRRLSGF